MRCATTTSIEGTEQHCSFLASDKMLEGRVISVVGMIHLNHLKNPKHPKPKSPKQKSPWTRPQALLGGPFDLVSLLSIP